MPTDALLRPAALHQFTSNSAYDERMSPSARERWSPTSSDSGDDESTDARDEDELNNAPMAPAPAPAAVARPSGGFPLRAMRQPSPPRSSPMSPLAAGPRPQMPRRLSPLAPMGSGAAPSPSAPRPQLSLPKGQPLARSLLNRAVNGASQPQRPKKTTKLIVATKPMRTTFQLSLSAEELARKS
ncbi:uncharacterized protein CcaverHIS019_0503000 [Cutaneotrichosporon cavernicola]|uniref:Uncharacterized protein n=1 Tax=Cutaneotrichosporon cavernicola TaxID=279322 RepID=A0AA48QWY0_9TREE|nr:uncharacterized protein CcaverHIS019_0503000 [Cutaneotrichosporon cavernicola]BEI92672.1 hypothetical protein CcaverHIS019_0503000 [Cutaneotrichosporon cavernicola]BEJ00447.1 hypothetical protein CcaverHIS631_0503040 [Cutaneotrichosporon cavernicola]BEJ08216.1 hypothetical protein CcaverHIS641_0503010 [Cutaneotrichosporon cavernicola]